MKAVRNFDWSSYKPQGVTSVDMAASIIVAHRLKHVPIKTIHMIPRHYDTFRKWFEKVSGREHNPKETLTFDGVDIVCGTKYQNAAMLIELWENDFNIDKAVKEMTGSGLKIVK